MQPLFDRIVVVDLTVSSWDGSPPSGEQSEILEVGACVLDPATGEIEDASAVVVRPSRSTLSPECAEETGLTRAELATGVAFMDACGWLRKTAMSHLRPCAYFDVGVPSRIAEQCKHAEARTARIPLPLSPRRVDVGCLAEVALGAEYPLELDEVLGALGLDPTPNPFRAADRADGAARALARLVEGMRGLGSP